jgi:hypothetical protein
MLTQGLKVKSASFLLLQGTCPEMTLGTNDAWRMEWLNASMCRDTRNQRCMANGMVKRVHVPLVDAELEKINCERCSGR